MPTNLPPQRNLQGVRSAASIGALFVGACLTYIHIAEQVHGKSLLKNMLLFWCFVICYNVGKALYVIKTEKANIHSVSVFEVFVCYVAGSVIVATLLV